MKLEIENALRPILGEPLTDMWRYAGMQKFEFGVQRWRKNRKGENITVADWGLVVSCNWKLTDGDTKSISKSDFVSREKCTPLPVLSFLETLLSHCPVVVNVTADGRGGLQIEMQGGYLLTVTPDAHPNEPDETLWRFMPPGDSDHFVVTYEGIER